MIANPYDVTIHEQGRPKFAPGDILCFRPKHNSPPKKDVTGAFAPEAEHFCKFHGVDPDSHIVVIDNGQAPNKRSRYPMATEVIEAIKARKPKVTAFFCHGFTHYIQLGPRSPKHPFAQPNDKKLFERFL